MFFGLLYFCVLILCVNRSRSSFILYPMSYYNMVRPVQLQNIPPPVAQNFVNSRVSQPVTCNLNPVGGSVPVHQQTNAQGYIPRYTSVVPTNDVQLQCREDVLQPGNHN